LNFIKTRHFVYLTHSLIHFTHSLIHSTHPSLLACLLARSLTHSLTYLLTHSLTYSPTLSLTTVTRLETKRSSARPPFNDKRINSLVGCAFWGSDKPAPSVPCHSFYIPLGCSSTSSKTISTC